jgi:hypothetical protein
MPLLNDGERIYENVEPNSTNIKAHIKKRVRFEEEEEEHTTGRDGRFAGLLHSVLHEDNLLVLVVLFIAGTPGLTKYIYSLPLLGSYANGDLMTTVIKSAVLFALFIVIKTFIIPRLNK